ncbi:hypothetical protein BDV10DRAFT_184633 [Aspergillus recurvatus]
MTVNSHSCSVPMNGGSHYPNGSNTNGNQQHSDRLNMNGNGIHLNDTNSDRMNGYATNGHHVAHSAFRPIAICGMACRLPGGIASPEQLWEFLIEGGDARSRVPDSRFNISAYYSPDKKPGATNTEFGYFLDESVDLGALDMSFFSMPRNEAARLDPQQRLLLEVARESIDDAGEVGWKGSNIGVYVGTFGQDWYDSFQREVLKYGIYQATATHDFMMSERLSHEMDLRGPSVTIRTACSSALVGLNEACLAISRGDCDSAIVGGTSIIMAPALMTAMAEQGVLSPDGSCKTFSASADGYARGEAIVSVYVKSLDVALRDGNPIRSVIAGTAANFDGKTPTLSMPNPEAQEALIRRAYEGAAWPQFGRELFRTNTTFAQTMKRIDKHLQSLGAAAPSWTLAEELEKPAKTSRVYKAEFSQPLCTAVQVALVDTLSGLGVWPAAVVGHSSGEIAAAYAAGGLTAEEAIAIAFHRGVTTRVQTRLGGMAAVGLGWDEARQYLVPGVVIACDNSPGSVTLSGDADKLADVVAAIKQSQPDVSTTTLKVETAYHSHHMEALGEGYQQAMVASGVVGRAPKIPFYSSVTGKRFGLEGCGDEVFAPQYWRANLERPVLFRSAVSDILHSPDIKNEVFLELGPHPALASPLRQILSQHTCKAPYIASLIRSQNVVEAFLQAIGKLYTLRVDIDFKALMSHGAAVTGLPRYPWDHQRRHWYESRVSKEWRHREHPAHDLLGIRVPESTELDPVWRNLLHIENVPWLCDHKINEDIVFPFAAYVAMAAEAARQISGVQDGVSLRHVVVTAALLVDEEAATELVTSLRRHRLTDSLNSEWWDFSISSHNGDVWTKHCTGQVRAESVKQSPQEKQEVATATLPRKVNIDRWNATLRRSGLNYGPSFTTLTDVHCSTGSAHSAIGHMQNNRWGDERRYHLHPVVLDSYFQLLSVAHGNGVAHRYRRLIAASVENLTLYRCSDETISLAATAVFTEDGLIGHGSCKSNARTILQASGVRVSFFEEADGADDERRLPITARCQWVPHIDFQDPAGLIHEPAGFGLSLSPLAELANR